MAAVYIEQAERAAGRYTHIEDYVVEDHANPCPLRHSRQVDAIAWAKKNGHSPYGARVRHLKKTPNYWRAD